VALVFSFAGESPLSRTHPRTRIGSKINFSLESFLSLLSQYRFCAAGIGLGTAYSLRFKKGSVIPMVAAGAMGTTADMVYGYLVECAHFRDGSSQGTDVVSSPMTAGSRRESE